MKELLTMAVIGFVLICLLVVAVISCDKNKNRLYDTRTENAILRAKIDSLQNRAAIDCAHQIDSILNIRNHEKSIINAPVKPDFLR